MKAAHLIALVFGLALLASACGDDASDATDAADTADAASPTTDTEDASPSDFPVTIESDGGTWTLEAQPERIVSLSPTATEILFAVGAGDQIVAADAFSNYPPEAPTTELSGFDPNIEAITAYEPDLVVIANDANDMITSLTELDIPVLVSPAPIDLEQGYDEMAALGLAAGRVDETAIAVADLRTAMDAAFALAPGTAVRIYHELDETFYSASSNSFIGAVYSGMDAENVADAADTDGFGFPQLTEEYIVEADPEVIVITDQVSYGPDELASRPGWDQISAVQAGNIVVVEADVASRWGPRLPQFVTAVAEALGAVESAAVGS